jgi:hypothetical protein
MLHNYNDPYKKYNNIMTLYDSEFIIYNSEFIIYNKYDRLKKMYYLIKILKYIDFNIDDYIDYTFDSIYKDICIFYNKKITLFKLAYIECKKTNQEVYNQFIDNNL